MQSVQFALGLSKPRRGTWSQAVAGEHGLFIAPAINGWILITGSGLPDPEHDVDVCFRWLLQLSRKLGHVQFFSANNALGHHAWVRAEAGAILRAYAWAGKTLWNQGAVSTAEQNLNLKCFQYAEPAGRLTSEQLGVIAFNTEMVPLLAASWSVDPSLVSEQLLEHPDGIAGEAPRLY